MTATVHTVTTETDDTPPRPLQHRWTCSCGVHGVWKPRMGQARQGGALHARRVKR